MKLSCLPVSYFPSILSGRMSIQHWVREARGLGLQGVDLSILFFRERNRVSVDQVRSSIAEAGLKLAVVNTYSDLTHPDASVRKEECRQLEADIETAALLGAENVRIVSGQAHPETSDEEGLRWALAGFLHAEAVARRCNVQLVYENHSKPGNWQYSDFSLAPERFLRIARELAATQVKILFDTANPIVFGVEPLPLLQQVVERVTCVHAADTLTRGSLKPAVIGRGLVPFPELFSCLKAHGYSGWISIEEASGSGEAGVRVAVEFVRRAWAGAAPAPA